MARDVVRTVVEAGDVEQVVAETEIGLADVRGGLETHADRLETALADGPDRETGDGSKKCVWEAAWEAAETNPRLLAILGRALEHVPGTPVRSLDRFRYAQRRGIPGVTKTGVGTAMTNHGLGGRG
jgi:hypothetical protein